MSARDTALARWSAQIGAAFPSRTSITVTQPMIDAFADTTRDHQWIHVDADRARQTPFGGTIAHGFLTLSLASQFMYEIFPEDPGQTMGINYGFDRLRFLSPVTAGATLTASVVLNSVTPRKSNELMRGVTFTMLIENEDRPAFVADWLGLLIFDTQL
jgi:acyl dehydratase